MKKTVTFFDNGNRESLKNWEKKLHLWDKDIKLVDLDSNDANASRIALLWNAPMEKVLKLESLTSIISLGQGVDHIIKNRKLDSKFSVYRIVDPFMARSMSHWVILSILIFLRDYEGYRLQQKKYLFKNRNLLNYNSIKIGIYGVGEIGKVVAEDLSFLGFEVLGWSKTKKNNHKFQSFTGKRGFDFLLKESNIHVCLLPLTDETYKIFNKDSFSKMKNKVCFINAGRGDQVDEKDLLNFCKNKISLAILDVFSEEPLPSNHPFWKVNNIIIWPHVAAETNVETASEQIAKAITTIFSNKIPENRINLDRQY